MKPDQISLPFTIGNKEKKVIVTFPNGASGLGHIYIDNWYQGQVVKQEGEWRVYLNERSLLSVEDAELVREVLLV